MTPGEIGIACSIIGAVIAIATFARVVISEANRATRQLEILRTIEDLRKEIADGYVSGKVFEPHKASNDLRFTFVEQRVARLEERCHTA